MKPLNRLGLTLLLVPAFASAQESSYDPKGRRDPFVSFTTLIATEKPRCPGPGLSSRLVQEVTLSGIVRTQEGRRALLVTPDGQTHFASERSRLCDGHVMRIDANAVIFVKRQSDPLLPEREIEVRRLLHPER
jgi:type IV pilus assembly protein PilP